MVSPLIYERASVGGTHRRRVNGSRLARATSGEETPTTERPFVDAFCGGRMTQEPDESTV